MTFHFKSGRVAHNENDLKKELKLIGAEEFNHHVNNEKNDFANWIEHTLKKKSLAEKVRKQKSKEGIIKSLEPTVKKRTVKKVTPKPAKKTVNKPTKSKKSTSKATKKTVSKPTKNVTPKKTVSPIRRHVHNKPVSYVSTEAPDKFILKEFLMGALFGLLLGLMLMAMIARIGY